jgi:hypothetical protein
MSSHFGSEGGQRMLLVERKEHCPSESLWHHSVRNTLQRIGEGEKANDDDDASDDGSPEGLSKVSRISPFLHSAMTN